LFQQDLAALVDGQQEQIDKVAEGTEESKAHTKAGLEHIQQGILGMCGPMSTSEECPKDGVRVGEEFQWSMPFETLGGDMLAVHQDVMRFGRNLMEDLQENVQEKILEKGCTNVASDCHATETTRVS
jgi:hypothetical protein